MEDRQIVDLYFARSERAVYESQYKYGRMLLSLALSLLSVREDAEECENDTYLTAWNKIPPDRPDYLGAYLSKITRFLCMNLLRKRTADKRPSIAAALDELAECLPAADTVEGALENERLKEALNGFLRGLPADHRYIFVRRYYFNESIETIASSLSFGTGKVKTILFRTREKLKALLEKEELL